MRVPRPSSFHEQPSPREPDATAASGSDFHTGTRTVLLEKAASDAMGSFDLDPSFFQPMSTWPFFVSSGAPSRSLSPAECSTTFTTFPASSLKTALLPQVQPLTSAGPEP